MDDIIRGIDEFTISFNWIIFTFFVAVIVIRWGLEGAVESILESSINPDLDRSDRVESHQLLKKMKDIKLILLVLLPIILFFSNPNDSSFRKSISDDSLLSNIRFTEPQRSNYFLGSEYRIYDSYGNKYLFIGILDSVFLWNAESSLEQIIKDL